MYGPGRPKFVCKIYAVAVGIFFLLHEHSEKNRNTFMLVIACMKKIHKKYFLRQTTTCSRQLEIGGMSKSALYAHYDQYMPTDFCLKMPTDS